MKGENINHKQRESSNHKLAVSNHYKRHGDRKRSAFLEDLRMLTRSSYWDYFDHETKGIILTQLGTHHGFYNANE